MGLSYIPTSDAEDLQRRLELLMVPGTITDPDLERRLRRLDGLFRIYTATCPVPLWAPGLILTNEITNQAERYLPVTEIAHAFGRFCRLAISSPDPADLLPFQDALGWLSILEKLAWAPDANPARLLMPLFTDWELRCRFLFSLHLPKQHGGDFVRYPVQMRALAEWLSARRSGTSTLNCLDAACGTGEGTWDLAGALLAAGFTPEAVAIKGLTLGALELFAAAHAFFPHDINRQYAYRAEITPLLDAGIAERMLFRQADLRSDNGCQETYGVILCNGLLGGPMLHDRRSVGRVVRSLAASLEPGGILMAADRFHAGWHKVFPREQLEELLVGCGLHLVEGGEGVAGVRT